MRYVVLHHEGFGDAHFDLMFESAPDSSLMTWRATDWPLAAGDVVIRIGDHRRAYLEYEGPVSNDRGHVRRIAAGNCTIDASPTLVSIEISDAGETTLIILNLLDENRWQVTEVS